MKIADLRSRIYISCYPFQGMFSVKRFLLYWSPTFLGLFKTIARHDKGRPGHFPGRPANSTSFLFKLDPFPSNQRPYRSSTSPGPCQTGPARVSMSPSRASPGGLSLSPLAFPNKSEGLDLPKAFVDIPARRRGENLEALNDKKLPPLNSSLPVLLSSRTDMRVTCPP